MNVKNVLVGQSGGPTAAINASLSGVINASMESQDIGAVYGAIYGVEGIIGNNLINIGEYIKSSEDYSLLEGTPSMALGSCRYKLPHFDKDEQPYKDILKTMEKYNIGYFFYIGGNDSMDTVLKLDQYFQKINCDIKVIGIPKTIDNDLPVTDHTPGFGSAAKFVATIMSEVAMDSCVYDMKSVTIVELMGRNSGWLTAASVLSRNELSCAPHLIYLPEIPFSEENFLADINEKHFVYNNLVIAVSEGVRFNDGHYASTTSNKSDVFGHSYLSGVGKYLENVVADKIGCKVRSVELSVLQRSSAHVLSMTDITEARNIASEAVITALRGKSGIVMTIERVSNSPYKTKFGYSDAIEIANIEKKVPINWISDNGNDVTTAMVDYLKPLVVGEVKHLLKDGIPKYFYFPKPHLI